MRVDRRIGMFLVLGAACTAGCSRMGGAAKPVAVATAGIPHRIVTLATGPNAEEETLKALIQAKPGDILEFGEGAFHFTQGLDLRCDGVTIRGKGIDKTILSFQKEVGKAGLNVGHRDRFTIEDLTVENSPGDGIKVEGGENIAFRRVRARWTGPASEKNGAYGLYPVQCKNVLIEECLVNGASDAGIYVGQSRNIIVRKCRAEGNVAGIEIENSINADVYDNVATNNAGGLLVFDLPGLQVKNGRHVRVFQNQVFANNHENFAPKGNTVAQVPPGTGVMVMATDQVEVFKNVIKDNQTHNMVICSYLITNKPIEDKDKAYDPYPEDVYVHDNQFENGGTKPAGPLKDLMVALVGARIPDIVYDGVTPPTAKAGQRFLFLKNNGQATFANIAWRDLPDPANARSLEFKAKVAAHALTRIKRDLKEYEGELPPLSAVQLEGVPQ